MTGAAHALDQRAEQMIRDAWKLVTTTDWSPPSSWDTAGFPAGQTLHMRMFEQIPPLSEGFVNEYIAFEAWLDDVPLSASDASQIATQMIAVWADSEIAHDGKSDYSRVWAILTKITLRRELERLPADQRESLRSALAAHLGSGRPELTLEDRGTPSPATHGEGIEAHVAPPLMAEVWADLMRGTRSI